MRQPPFINIAFTAIAFINIAAIAELMNERVAPPQQRVETSTHEQAVI